MMTFRGYRMCEEHTSPPTTADEVVVLVDTGDEVRHLQPTRFAIHTSPSGFNWGYNGAGPAALAHSILWEALGSDIADREWQTFLREVVSRLPVAKPWTFSKDRITTWYVSLERKG